MKVSDLGEFNLIDKLTKILPVNDKDVLVGFGDDCSCVNINEKLILFTNDIQIENRHFIKELQKPEDIGWKLISVNVSDVVACGGIPRWAQISLGLPKGLEYYYIEKVYTGIKKALDHYKFSVTGGNVSSSSEIILDLFLVGETKKFLSRSTAKPQEFVYINGYTGLARAGLELLLKRKKEYEAFEKRLIDKFTKPIIDTHIVDFLQKTATSCIDISDGLVADLGHISKQSGVQITLENLPVHPDLELFCKKYNKDPYEYILYGGEDYILAFSSKEDISIDGIFKVGYTTEGQGIYLKDKEGLKPLKTKGFEHL